MSMEKTAVQTALDQMGTVVAQGPVTSFMRTAEPGDVRFAFAPIEKLYAETSIGKCNEFAKMRGLPEVDHFSTLVDLMAAHTNDHPIDFKRMYESANVDAVMQFIAGVGLRINRKTGRLADAWRGEFHVRTS